MASISLLTITGMTAADGSYVASGATVKFRTTIEHTGGVRIETFVYRNETAYASGYTSFFLADAKFPKDFILIYLNPDQLYNFNIVQLYNRVRDMINQIMEVDIVDVFIQT